MKKVIVSFCLTLCVSGVCAEDNIGYDEFPILYAQLEANIEDITTATRAVGIFQGVDAANLASEGEKKALQWTRKYLELYPTEVAKTITRSDNTGLWSFTERVRKLALEYLTVKGDERDIDIVSRFNSDYGRVLKERVAGKNFFDYDGIVGLGNPRFLPSVANTGPQAVYVREILYRAWEEAGMDSSKIPSELLTMVLSFGADENPVSSVDLTKHGLSMPVITPKPHRDFFHRWNEDDGGWGLSPLKLTVNFPDLAEPVEITPYADRRSPEWQGLYARMKREQIAPKESKVSKPEIEQSKQTSVVGGKPPISSSIVVDEMKRTSEGEENSSPPSRVWFYVGIAILVAIGGGIFAWRKK
jgi:hypothetical protein